MTWTFDTGRTKSQRSLVMEKVIAALSPLLAFDAMGNAQQNGFLQLVTPFGGVVRSYTDDAGIDQVYQLLQGMAPAVAVGLGDKRSDRNGMASHNQPRAIANLEVIVYVCNRNNASLLARTEGDGSGGTDVGMWHALERIEELLNGLEITFATLAPGGETPTNKTYTKLPGKDVKRLVPVTEEELATTNELTLWKQSYLVQVTRNINMQRSVTDRLASIDTMVKTTDVVPGTIDEITTLVP